MQEKADSTLTDVSQKASQSEQKVIEKAVGKVKKPRKPHRPFRMLRLFVFSIFVAIFLRLFFFDTFCIPTPSMENTLLVGDYVLVSKWDYGARTPMTIGIPFTNSYFEGWTLPFTRLWGKGKVQRGDVVVFNFPLDTTPIDRKTPYVKRSVALPGDTLVIESKVLKVNGNAVPLLGTQQQNWLVTFTDDHSVLPQARVEALQAKVINRISGTTLTLQATNEAVEALKQLRYVHSIEPLVRQGWMDGLFPKGTRQSSDDYLTLIVPKVGQKVTLSAENWHLYHTLITQHEHHKAIQNRDGTFTIDGKVGAEYTFNKDYYFMLGDNRDNSLDSRFWGFVPEDHVLGKAKLVYFSWDNEKNVPRLDRVLKFIQ
jgi:signal peptidase I